MNKGEYIGRECYVTHFVIQEVIHPVCRLFWRDLLPVGLLLPIGFLPDLGGHLSIPEGLEFIQQLFLLLLQSLDQHLEVYLLILGDLIL